VSREPSVVEDQESLMEDDRKINDVNSQEYGFGRGKFAVDAKEHNREGNDSEFPDPETVSVQGDHRSDDGVDFHPAAIQDDCCEQGVQNIQSQDQHQEEEQG
jgi:hypothetical protein